MSPTTTALLGYTAVTLVLLMSLGGYRTLLALTQGRAANSFSPTGEDTGPFGQRLARAHANCYENLPVVGALLLFALATDQTRVTDPLALALLGARIAQSIVHLISTSRIAVLIRFGFFIVQLVILVIWLLRFAGLI